MDETQYDKFVIQNYLKSDSDLKNSEKYLLLKFRTRMAEVKVNFKGKYEDLLCPLCNIEQDSQSHLFNCNVLIENCKELFDNQEVEYEDIFSNQEKQNRVIKLLNKMWQTREQMTSK